MGVIKEGSLVMVTSPHNFKGPKLGVVLGKCKYDDGKKVQLTDSTLPFREICIQVENGDTIVSITKDEKVGDF